jgi:hypothetical protein
VFSIPLCYIKIYELYTVQHNTFYINIKCYVGQCITHIICFKSCILLLGSGILKFFQMYGKVAHHLLYSLLIGRTIVLVGRHNCEHKASHIMNVLSPYVPLMSGQEVKILRFVEESRSNKIVYAV